MVSSNLVMSDLRGSRLNALGLGRFAGPTIRQTSVTRPTRHPDALPVHSKGAVRLYAKRPSPAATQDNLPAERHARERQLELLIRRLPRRLQRAARWLRQPSARWVRLPAGVLLILGGVFSILPLLGLWMLPLGIVLLAEDVKPLRRVTDLVLSWIERRRPHWMGVSDASHGQRDSSGRNPHE